jgi:hypothetical protein
MIGLQIHVDSFIYSVWKSELQLLRLSTVMNKVVSRKKKSGEQKANENYSKKEKHSKMDILLEEHAISSLVFSSLFTFSNSE